MELQARPFNVETMFVKARRRPVKKLRGADSPLYAAIWPMVYVVRLFGFVPYDFSQDRLVPSNGYLTFSAIAATLYSYILYVVIKRFMNVDREDVILGGTENTKVIINYSVVMYELGLVVFTRDTFTRTWNALQDYDDSVRQLGFPRKETQTATYAWIITILTTVVWTSINRFGMYAFIEPWLYNMGYMLAYIGTLMAVYKFAAMALFLGQRFHHLNAIAMRNLPSMSATGDSTTVISRKTILSLHNDLMIAAENFEAVNSWSLLFWISNLCLHTVSNIYFIIEWILKRWDMGAWPLIRCQSVWLIAFVFQLLLLHIACDFASSQANYMGPILIEWQVRVMRKKEECAESLLQFINRKLNFSAGGCFYVNLPLLRSIAALLTTYLVILLQFPD